MRMNPETYETLLDEFRTIVRKLEETGASLRPGVAFDPDNITMRDMWDIRLVADMDRANQYHPRHDYPGLLPRCLEFTDRSPYWLSRDEDLDDSHIETALRKIMVTLADDRTQKPTVSASAPGMR